MTMFPALAQALMSQRAPQSNIGNVTPTPGISAQVTPVKGGNNLGPVSQSPGIVGQVTPQGGMFKTDNSYGATPTPGITANVTPQNDTYQQILGSMRPAQQAPQFGVGQMAANDGLRRAMMERRSPRRGWGYRR